MAGSIMNSDKVTEFTTVLVFAIAVGTAIMLAVQYLEGTVQAIVLILIGAAAITAWQYLRKRFGRQRR